MVQAHPQKVLAKIATELLPSQSCFTLFLNAQILGGFYMINCDNHLICEQPDRSHYLALKNSGYNVHAQLSESDKQANACLILWGKFRQLNEFLVQRARALCAPDALIIIAGAKNEGIASAKKRISKLHNIEGSYSKHHAMSFWYRNDKMTEEKPVASIVKKIVSDEEYETASGLFSSDKIDAGSALLAEYFDDSISGSVADLGAGWGYLSLQLLRRSSDVSVLDLYESNWHAVGACQRNLDRLKTTTNHFCHWLDVVNEPISEKYDYVIMNPPFHIGSQTSLVLGLDFIRKAAAILKPAGKLLMVANRHLAYEEVLRRHFSAVKILREAQGFKVISAKK